MTEHESPKVIDFASRRAAKAPEASLSAPTPRQLFPAEPIQLPVQQESAGSSEMRMVIPSLRKMYDLDAITLDGLPLSEAISTLMEEVSEADRPQYEYAIEMKLFAERRSLISRHITDPRQRRLPYRDLITHTLERAEDLGEVEGRDFRQELRNIVLPTARAILGNHEALIVIQNHDRLTAIHNNEAKKTEKTPHITKGGFTVIK